MKESSINGVVFREFKLIYINKLGHKYFFPRFIARIECCIVEKLKNRNRNKTLKWYVSTISSFPNQIFTSFKRVLHQFWNLEILFLKKLVCHFRISGSPSQFSSFQIFQFWWSNIDQHIIRERNSVTLFFGPLSFTCEQKPFNILISLNFFWKPFSSCCLSIWNSNFSNFSKPSVFPVEQYSLQKKSGPHVFTC